MMLDQLFADMLGARLDELSQSANPPFLRAAADRGLFPTPRTKDEAVLQALVSNDGVTRGLDALVTELQRVARFGFTATELARAKQAMMLGYERVVDGEPGPRVGEPRRRVHAQFSPGRSAADDLAGARVPPAVRAGHHAGRGQRAHRTTGSPTATGWWSCRRRTRPASSCPTRRSSRRSSRAASAKRLDGLRRRRGRARR